MATFRKRKSSWQAIVDRKGVFKSASFPTKAKAQAWATQTEADIVAGILGIAEDHTFGALLKKYSEEKSPKKEGSRWEQIRIKMYLRDFPDLMKIKVSRLDGRNLSEWRDARLKEVASATVQREWNLLSKAINTAIREWKWMQSNPLKEIDRPPSTEPRDRRITDDEIQRLMFSLGYEYDTPPKTISARVGAMFLFAMETAMRCKEMCILRREWVDLERRVCLVPKKSVAHTKTGGRSVPLTREAMRIIQQMPKDTPLVFNLKESQVDALYRKGRDNALIEDLHFHDTKHEATTRLAPKMSPYDLARMIGTRNLKILMGYYNKSASDIAAGLD